MVSEKTEERIRRFVKDRDWQQFHTEENLAKCISIEAGELLECFQWGADFDIAAVKEELADVLIYCLDMCHRLGVNADGIINEKMEKNISKYPVEKSRGNSKKYTEL